jgi:hypothetical protein
LKIGESMPPPCPSSSAKPTQSMAPSTLLQPAESPRVCCTLWDWPGWPWPQTGHQHLQGPHRSLKIVDRTGHHV